jgi:hypothetical protein
MNSIKDLINKLTETQDEIYSKIGIYQGKNEDSPNLCTVKLLDGSMLYNVRISADPYGGSKTDPSINSSVIVTFLSKEDAFISLISNADNTRLESTNSFGDITSLAIINENNQTTVGFNNVENFNANTVNGGTLSIYKEETNDSFLVKGVSEIRMGVNNGSEIIINDEGIDILTTSHILIGNDIFTLKDALIEIVNTLLTVPLIPLVPTVVLDPVTITTLIELKVKINNLLK